MFQEESNKYEDPNNKRYLVNISNCSILTPIIKSLNSHPHLPIDVVTDVRRPVVVSRLL